jgi:hypothetical protein
MASGFQLAQVNVARMAAPREDPRMAGFFDRLAEINAVAESAPGFVWRLKDEDAGDATYIRPFEDVRILFNMSVWVSVEALANFTYRTDHKVLFAGRKAWFEPMGTPSLALWWIAAGHTPSIGDAKERLDHLQSHGPTPYAFTFKQAFPAPAETGHSAQFVLEAGSGL